MSGDWVESVGTISAVVLPLFNVPLILKIVKRKSASDFSVSWAVGVWVCILLMSPQAFRSPDMAFRVFGIFNLIFFSLVTFFVLKYRKSRQMSFPPPIVVGGKLQREST